MSTTDRRARRGGRTAHVVGVTLAVAAVMSGSPDAAARRDGASARVLTSVTVDNGSTPFSGDGRRLATISPNGDGFRDAAHIHLRLTAAANVVLEVAQTKPVPRVVYSTTFAARRGTRTATWAPAASIAPRTYVVRFRVTSPRTRPQLYGARLFAEASGSENVVVRVQGVDSAFAAASYRPGQRARLTVATDARWLAVQVFHIGGEAATSHRNDTLEGTAVSAQRRVGVGRDRPTVIGVRVGAGWPSGVYYARLVAPDGRLGYAPLIVAPRRLGANRLAVVLPTNSWQAYNLYDANGDGWGDTWYAAWAIRETDTTRAYLHRGVPPYFRAYDLPFLHWLGREQVKADFLSERDLEQASSGDTLARAYTAIVFPGHHEYVSAREYAIVRRYRDRGGHLAWLSANNFFWKVVQRGPRVERVAQWRALGLPEASLIGVQYRGNDNGTQRRGFTVQETAAAPWLFAGTDLCDGASFGSYGIEIDSTAPSSPPGTTILARIPNLYGPGFNADMTYYETGRGAKVFAAGAFTLAGDAGRPVVGRLLTNLLEHLGHP